MRALICVNSKYGQLEDVRQYLISVLIKHGVEYVTSELDDEPNNANFDVLFIIGGDGTILRKTEFCSVNNIPIIGINGGKLGYLSEFECSEIDDAVELFLNNDLIEDVRLGLKITYNGREFFALNDVVVSRIYSDELSGRIIDVSYYIDQTKIDRVTGDGIIVSTPTGSTAYSLSAGGSILAPGISAFSVTPIAAHSLSQRSVIFSADSKCVLRLENENVAGLFIDGKKIENVKSGEYIVIEKSEKSATFLRRRTSNFYKKLSVKLLNRDKSKYEQE